ncbi:sigma-70 family RNA polymerase sigma factor [bacterium]|nr:sigma-70 family RNA polymerase sigma factor [bacterium]
MTKNNLPPFEIIFDKYKQKIFNLIYRLLNNPNQAEDLTQETFLRAYKAYNNFRQEADIYSWLYCIALNLCREKIRRLAKQRKNTIISLDQTFEDKDGKEINKQIPDPYAKTPLEILEKESTRSKIRTAIASLPEKYSKIIILREIEQFSYEEIAKILNISGELVGVRLIRARKMLKKKLKKFGSLELR